MPMMMKWAAEQALERSAVRDYEELCKNGFKEKAYQLKINNTIIKIDSFERCQSLKESLLPCLDWNNIKSIDIEEYNN